MEQVQQVWTMNSEMAEIDGDPVSDLSGFTSPDFR